jgi:hypothetical protein
MLSAAVILFLSATKEIGPGADVEVEINLLGPGDELVLRGGLYTLPTDRFSIDNAAGTAVAPIVVRSKTGERARLTRPDVNQNLIDIGSASYFTFKDIDFEGGSAGLRFQGGSHITVDGCQIYNTDDVALRANDTGVTYDSFHIVRNHIHDTGGTGEGMYLGCNNNGCVFQNAIIEGNWVHDTKGPNVSQGDGIEIKEGSHDNIVRDNVIHDTGYPCIITYSVMGQGGPNIIERNLLWNCGDHGIQSARDAVIRNNVILSAASDGIAMQPHQSGSPASLTVVHNTILDADGASISVRNPIGPVIIANNALYTQGAKAFLFLGTSSFITFEGNIGAGTLDFGSFAKAGTLASDFVAASFSGAVPNDPFPKAGGALIDAGVVARVPADDFNGTARNAVADVGAYAFGSGTNSGWTLQDALKSLPGAGGSGGAGGGSNGGAGGGSNGGAAGGSSGGAGGGSSGGAGGGSSGGAGGGAGGAGGGGEMVAKACGCAATDGIAALAALALALRRRRIAR